MTTEDEKIIEDVKFVLNSGDPSVIKALKAIIPAYLHCIAINSRHDELMAQKELLLKKQQELLAKKKELTVLKRKKTLLQKKKGKLLPLQVE